jgi:hypothetical protein
MIFVAGFLTAEFLGSNIIVASAVGAAGLPVAGRVGRLLVRVGWVA